MRALTGRTDAADDLVQDTLQRALEKWRLWQRERDLRPWLFSIMHNLHVDGRRRDQRVDFRRRSARLCRRPARPDALKAGDTAFRYARENGIDVFYWTDSRFSYALSGNTGREDMLRLATLVFQQHGK